MKASGYGSLIFLIIGLVLVSGIMIAPQTALANDEEGGNLNHTVSLESKSGFSLFLAKLYNEHRLLYALVVTGIMALLGTVVAVVTDYFLKWIASFRSGKTH